MGDFTNTTGVGAASTSGETRGDLALARTFAHLITAKWPDSGRERGAVLISPTNSTIPDAENHARVSIDHAACLVARGKAATCAVEVADDVLALDVDDRLPRSCGSDHS